MEVEEVRFCTLILNALVIVAFLIFLPYIPFAKDCGCGSVIVAYMPNTPVSVDLKLGDSLCTFVLDYPSQVVRVHQGSGGDQRHECRCIVGEGICFEIHMPVIWWWEGGWYSYGGCMWNFNGIEPECYNENCV